MPTLDLPVTGMTCRACEVKITKALTKVPRVTRVTASARRGVARVESTARIPRAQLAAAVTTAGYTIGEDDRSWVSRDRRVWQDVAAAVGMLAVVALALRATGALRVVDQVGGLAASGGLLVIVVLGLAAGLSTCMALVGGLVLALSARHAEQHQGATARQKLRPHVAFNTGRVVGFTVLGAVTGAIGSAVSLNGRVVALLMIVVSLVMVAVGLQLTSISPRLSRGLSLALPARLSAALGVDRAEQGYSDRTAALLGAGTFFLPCGFTQAVQVYALSTGSPVRAGAVMGLFALGTVPGLLGVGGVTAAVRGTFATRFFRFAGVTVLVFAAVNLSGALGILAPNLLGSLAGSARDTISTNVSLEGEVQVLHTTQVADGYEPADATVYVGRPVRWEIESTALTCASALYAPDLDIQTNLDYGPNTFTFTPTETGTIHYSCIMGMYTGTITVIDAPATPQASGR